MQVWHLSLSLSLYTAHSPASNIRTSSYLCQRCGGRTEGSQGGKAGSTLDDEGDEKPRILCKEEPDHMHSNTELK